MQALVNKRITVFGGDQTRPNIHIQDITDVFIHFLNLGNNATGIYNAGFENISILDIAKRVRILVPAEIVVSPTNDPRSYRLSSDKLLATDFKPKFSVESAIKEIIKAFDSGDIKNDEGCYNIKIMSKIREFT